MDETVREIWQSLGLPGLVDVHTHFMPKPVMDKEMATRHPLRILLAEDNVVTHWFEEPGINDTGTDQDPYEVTDPDTMLAYLKVCVCIYMSMCVCVCIYVYMYACKI